MSEILKGRTIALCVTGSIAAYKAVEFARLCIKAGAKVLPVMTASAARFLGPVTLSGICGEAVASDMWAADFSGERHVDLSERADAVVVVPATADALARFAQGRADDLVAALVLSAKSPVFVAPAMHPRMWGHPATVQNVARLLEQGRVQLVGPVSGEVASGDIGVGRMAEPQEIFDALVSALTTKSAERDMAGLRVVVTAGPTLEDLDPVRFIGNRSSGKMGFAIARAASQRGATVTLIAGPVALPTPRGAIRVDVRSAIEMRAALWKAVGADLGEADVLIMTAAVGDYRAKAISDAKLKKQGEHIAIDLVKNPDLLAEIGAARKDGRPHPILVGFAVESGTDEDLIDYATTKLASKRVDFVVANAAKEAFSGDDNRAFIVSSDGAHALGQMSKARLADVILDRVMTDAPIRSEATTPSRARRS